MGMFDYVTLAEPNKELVCAEGHLHKEFQTKDLIDEMAWFYIRDNKLYKLKDSMLRPEEPNQKLEFQNITETIGLHDFCNECPIQVESTDGKGVPFLVLHPFNQFELKIENGNIINYSKVHVQTRQECLEEFLRYQPNYNLVRYHD